MGKKRTIDKINKWMSQVYDNLEAEWAKTIRYSDIKTITWLMDVLATTPKYRNNKKFDYSLLLLDILDPRKADFTYVKKWDPLKWHANVLKSECENMLQKISDAWVVTITSQTIKDTDKTLFRKLRKIPKKDQNGNIDYLGIFKDVWVKWLEKFTREVRHLYRGKDAETRNQIRIKTLNDFFKRFFEYLDSLWVQTFSPYDIKHFDDNMYEPIKDRYIKNGIIDEKSLFQDINLPNKDLFRLEYKQSNKQFYLKKIISYIVNDNHDYRDFMDLVTKYKFEIFFERMNMRNRKHRNPKTLNKLFPNLYSFIFKNYKTESDWKVDRSYIWRNILTKEQKEKFKFKHTRNDTTAKYNFGLFFEKLEAKWLKKRKPKTVATLSPSFYIFLLTNYQAKRPNSKIDRFYIWAHILTESQRKIFKFEHSRKKYGFREDNKLLSKHKEFNPWLLHHQDTWENPEDILIRKEDQVVSEEQIEKILQAIDTLPAEEKKLMHGFLSWKDISEDTFVQIAEKLKKICK